MCFAEWKRESLHSILFCFVFFNELRWNTTKNIDIWKWREKKSIFLLQMGFGWSEVNLIQKPGSHRRMKHSTETKGHRKKKPTHLDRSQPAYVHTFGNILYRLYCYYFMATPFYSIFCTFLGKSIFFGITKYFPNELKNFLPSFKHIEFLCLSMDWIHFHELFASSFFAKHTAAHALEHCKQSSLTVFSSKQRHNFQFNKFHAAHGLLYWYE